MKAAFSKIIAAERFDLISHLDLQSFLSTVSQSFFNALFSKDAIFSKIHIRLKPLSKFIFILYEYLLNLRIYQLFKILFIINN